MKSFLSFIKKVTLLIILVCSTILYFQHKTKAERQKIQNAYNSGHYEEVVSQLQSRSFDPQSLNAAELEYLNWLAESSFILNLDSRKAHFETLFQQTLSLELKSKAALRLAEIYQEAQDGNKALEYLNAVSDTSSPQIALPAIILKAEIEHAQKKTVDLNALRKHLPEAFETSYEEAYMNILGKLNIENLYSPRLDEHSIRYRILPGDTLSKIAEQFNTTSELIKKANNLTRSIIHPNNHLKITQSRFEIYINKITNRLVLLQNGKFFKSYLVGTGKNDVTPAGEFVITSKQEKPTWYHPNGSVIPFGHEGNLLGTHWMGINYPGYGIHGTWEEDSVGKNSSQGCIRLVNAEVEELFTILPINTRVVISDHDIWKELLKTT